MVTCLQNIYLLYGLFSEKSDVFNFGVMVLEIITGQKNASSYQSNTIAYDLLSYVSRIIKSYNLILMYYFQFLLCYSSNYYSNGLN